MGMSLMFGWPAVRLCDIEAIKDGCDQSGLP